MDVSWPTTAMVVDDDVGDDADDAIDRHRELPFCRRRRRRRGRLLLLRCFVVVREDEDEDGDVSHII